MISDFDYFPASNGNLCYCVKSEEEKFYEIINKNITSHYFNSQVSVISSDSELTNRISSALTFDTEYYLVLNLPVAELCARQFLKAFAEQGKLLCLSTNVQSDVENVAAYLPDGCLYLLVDKFTYLELGLQGQPSFFSLNKQHEKYVVKLTTLSKCFVPGKNNYERAISCLAESKLVFDMKIAWLPYEQEICPSSIAKYFYERGFKVEERKPHLDQKLLSNVTLPLLEDINKFKAVDIFEWLGCLLLDISRDQLASSIRDVENKSITVPSLTVITVKNFFDVSHIQNLSSVIQEYLKSRNKKGVPWLCVTVYGDPDSPVTWGHQENLYRTNGDNFYSLIISKEEEIMYCAYESRKAVRLYKKKSNKK